MGSLMSTEWAPSKRPRAEHSKRGLGLFKIECIRTDAFHESPCRQLAYTELATAGWVDWWTNRRLHTGRAEI